ncbi:MAG: preprotein translocase subunit YajC [Microbacteriaceae bacterium]|nr:preprotein translocase subunit YajC [Microbacteriaceae bacterium]
MDPQLILIVLAAGAFIVFQIFQGRKRKKTTEDRQLAFVPGVEIMTNYGLYGTILSIDEETNVAIIETTPGTTLMIHRQTILKLADYAPVAEDLDDAASDEATAPDAPGTVEPQFGERTNPAAPTNNTKKNDLDN